PSGDLGTGPTDPWFFVKVGNDAENFYLYRTRLAPPPAGGAVRPEDWLPEVRIDFDAWFELRQRAEEALLDLPPSGPDASVAVWSPDSTYAVVLNGRGRAPNLAAVRELSLGVWNQGEVPVSGVVWIDEFRLAEPVRDPGIAASVDVALDGGGALTSRLTITNRGPDFRQLRAEPSYQTDRAVTLRSTLALDRWMPAGWAVDVPLTLDLDRLEQAPKFLPGSDLRADRLQDLRPTTSRRTRVGIAFRRRTPAANPWVGFLVDGLSTRAAWTRARGSTVTSRHRSEGFDGGISWIRTPEARSVGLVPDFAEGLVRALLPGFLEDRVVDGRLRLTPVRVSLGSSYLRQQNRIVRFERIVTGAGEAEAEPTIAPFEQVEGLADVRLQPLPPLAADLTVSTVRDLLPAREAAADPAAQRLIERDRARAGGLDLGWETARSLRTRLAFTPRIVPWLRHDFDWNTTYRSDRSPNLPVRSDVAPDSVIALARDARGQREWGVALALDPAALAGGLGSGPGAADPGAAAASPLAWLRPLTAEYRDGVVSRFQREA